MHKNLSSTLLLFSTGCLVVVERIRVHIEKKKMHLFELKKIYVGWSLVYIKSINLAAFVLEHLFYIDVTLLLSCSDPVVIFDSRLAQKLF